jgi:hypothetical protein
VLQLCIKDINGNPLSGTSVSSTTQPPGAKPLSAVTNASGYVTFDNLTEGSYTFQIVKEGFEQGHQTITYPSKISTYTLILWDESSSVANSGDNSLAVLAGIVAVIVVVVVVAVIFVRRRWEIKLTSS